MWGKIKNTGDDWMYPKPLMDLRWCFIPCLNNNYWYINFFWMNFPPSFVLLDFDRSIPYLL